MNRCAEFDFWPEAVWESLSLSNLEVLASRILIFKKFESMSDKDMEKHWRTVLTLDF